VIAQSASELRELFFTGIGGGVLGIPFLSKSVVFLWASWKMFWPGAFSCLRMRLRVRRTRHSNHDNMKAIELRRLEGVAIKMAREWSCAFRCCRLSASGARPATGKICTKRSPDCLRPGFQPSSHKNNRRDEIVWPGTGDRILCGAFNVITQSYDRSLFSRPAAHLRGATT